MFTPRQPELYTSWFDITLQEIETFFEVTEEGHLTTNGFMQMYHLQTQNDPDETWNDLKTYKPV